MTVAMSAPRSPATNAVNAVFSTRYSPTLGRCSNSYLFCFDRYNVVQLPLATLVDHPPSHGVALGSVGVGGYGYARDLRGVARNPSVRSLLKLYALQRAEVATPSIRRGNPFPSTETLRE